MTGFAAEEIIEELFESILYRYVVGSEQSMKGSGFVFDYADELHKKFHKTNLKRVGSNIDSPQWLRNKKKQPENRINLKKMMIFALSLR